MPWVRLDDHFDEHPKIAAVGPLGIALWVAGLAYCNRNLTDGYIPWTVARSLLSWEFLDPTTAPGPNGQLCYRIGVSSGVRGQDVDSDLVIGLLLAARLWEQADAGYLVHDYAAFQPLKADILAERAQKQAAGRAGGIAAAQARAVAPATAPAKAPAQAESKPVPVSVSDPSPDPPTAQTKKSSRLSPTNGGPPQNGKPSDLDAAFINRMSDRFAADLGGHRGVLEHIEIAKAHRSWASWRNKQRGVLNWLLREQRSALAHHRPGQPKREYRPPGDEHMRHKIRTLAAALATADPTERARMRADLAEYQTQLAALGEPAEPVEDEDANRG